MRAQSSGEACPPHATRLAGPVAASATASTARETLGNDERNDTSTWAPERLHSRPMRRPMNFNAGPATLPLAALERAREELLDFAGTGLSVMEHSHRGTEYEAVHDEAMALLRE